MASETEQDRKLLPYLRMADEIQDHEPLVAYYCRSYALEKGMSISSKERTENTSLILASLVNQLEKDRKLIKLSPEDNLYVEAFASNILKKADEEYHAGRVDQNTSESFYAASIIFDIINQFGKLRPDIEEKLKYSVEKVANRKRAFKEGQRHVTLTTDTTTTSTHDLIQNASFSSTGLPSVDISSPYFDDRKELDIEQGSVVDVLIKWRNSHLKVKVNFDSDLVKDLGLKLLKLTKIKAETMKLLIPVPVGKGSKLVIPFSAEHSSLTLQEIAILEGKPIIMMGAFDDEIQEVSQSNSKKDSRIIGFDEEEKRLRQRSMGISQHSLRLPKGSYIFCDFKTLNIPGIELSPPASEALKRMHTLACDPGIIAIMNKHHWRVGVMTEMAPLGYVGVSPKCVLGYNRNFGEEISLRLRTDDLKGFRKYESIKKTLLHELAHMVYSEHDANFSLLDKQLNNEVSTLDWTKSRSHTLNGKHIYTHYNDEAYVKESYHISGQKLGGANLMPLSSARASAVVAAHNRYLSASTKTKEELQNAVQCILEEDNLHESSISVEPDPDDNIMKDEPDPDDGIMKYVPDADDSIMKDEPDPDDGIMKDEPDPDDGIMKYEPDPDDNIRKDEPDPDDGIMKDEPDPDDGIMKDEPDPDDGIMKDEPDPDDGIMKYVPDADDGIMKDEPDPDDGIMKDEPDPDDGIMKYEPDPDDNIRKDEPDPDDGIMKDEPDPDDGIMKDEPDPNDGIMKYEPDPDDNIRKGEPDPDDSIMKNEPDPDDSIMKEEPDPDDGIMKDEPDPDDGIMKDELDPDDSIMKDEPDPDDGITKYEPDPDDGITKYEPDPDDNITKDEPDPDDNIMKDEPDPDDNITKDVKSGAIQHSCSMDLSEIDELQRIEESIALICQRLQKSIELLRSDSTQGDTSSTIHTLFKIIMNVIEHPGNEKFRKLRKGNPLFQRTVANHQGAMDVLRVVGFCEAVITDEIGRSETYVVLKRNDPGLLWLAKSSLEVCFG